MRKSLNVKAGILLAILLAISASCSKYEDGPMISIYSKMERATGNWQFKLVREDGVDKTEDYLNQSVNMTKGGTLRWIQGYNGYSPFGFAGTWKFVNDKNQIEMHFNEGVEEEFTLIWDITRLAYADLQLARYEGAKKIEWRMWKHY
jgi:hypothetical protein